MQWGGEVGGRLPATSQAPPPPQTVLPTWIEEYSITGPERGLDLPRIAQSLRDIVFSLETPTLTLAVPPCPTLPRTQFK